MTLPPDRTESSPRITPPSAFQLDRTVPLGGDQLVAVSIFERRTENPVLRRRHGQVLVASGEPAGLLTRAVMMPAPETGSVERTPPRPLPARVHGDGRAISRCHRRGPRPVRSGPAVPRAGSAAIKRNRSSPFAARIVELAVCTQKTVAPGGRIRCWARFRRWPYRSFARRRGNGDHDERALAAQVCGGSPGKLFGTSWQTVPERLRPRRSRRSSAGF